MGGCMMYEMVGLGVPNCMGVFLCTVCTKLTIAMTQNAINTIYYCHRRPAPTNA